MTNLKQDLLNDIQFLKHKGKIYDIDKLPDIEKLFLTSKYGYKTRQVIKDIISIIEIEPKLKDIIPKEIKEKFFDGYKI